MGFFYSSSGFSRINDRGAGARGVADFLAGLFAADAALPAGGIRHEPLFWPLRR